MSNHEACIREIFHDNCYGSDLDFADIKTNKQTIRPKIYVKVKDFADNIFWWVIWDFTTLTGYIVRIVEFKPLDESKIAKSVYMHEIKQKAIVVTTSLTELKLKYDFLVEKYHLK
jgi:hypothetical protein